LHLRTIQNKINADLALFLDPDGGKNTVTMNARMHRRLIATIVLVVIVLEAW
jgi:hypothetical protein